MIIYLGGCVDLKRDGVCAELGVLYLLVFLEVLVFVFIWVGIIVFVLVVVNVLGVNL